MLIIHFSIVGNFITVLRTTTKELTNNYVANCSDLMLGRHPEILSKKAMF